MAAQYPKGVPEWFWDSLMAQLKPGHATPYEQRELYKILDHKYSGKPGAVKLTCTDSVRQLKAAFIEAEVRQEILSMRKMDGAEPHGGYRAAAIRKVARRRGARGEALGIWLHRNKL